MKHDEKKGGKTTLVKWIDEGTAPGHIVDAAESRPGGSGGKGGAARDATGGKTWPRAACPEGVDLRVQAGPLFAAVLLGLCELIFIGAAANYLSMRSVGIILLFMAQGVFISALSVASLAWGVVKIWSGAEPPLLQCVKAGVSLGLCAAVAVCALSGVFALAGAGPGGPGRNPYLDSGPWQTAMAYIGIFAGIMLLYAVAGAAAGAIAKLFLKPGGEKIAGAIAGLHAKPETEIAG